jgi:hypothetical protein
MLFTITFAGLKPCLRFNSSIRFHKVGYVIRDLLGDKYRSTSKSKVVARHRSSGVSPRREDSMTPPSATKKEEASNKIDRRKTHSRRHDSASSREGPTTSMPTTAPRPPSNTEEKKDLVVRVYDSSSSWSRNDMGRLEQHTKKYAKKNPPKSIQSDLKQKSSKGQEDHLLVVLAGADAEMTDFSCLSLNPQERNAYARAASRSPNPTNTLPISSGDLLLDGMYSADNIFPRAVGARNPIQTNTLPRSSSGDLDGHYPEGSSMFSTRAAPRHNEPNIPMKSRSVDLDDENYSGGSTMHARGVAHSTSHASILLSSGDLDQRYSSADSMFAHAARSPTKRANIFPSSGDQVDGKYPAKSRPSDGSNHSPGGAVLTTTVEEVGGSKNLIDDNFLSFLDQHMPSLVAPSHAGALSRPFHQANEYSSTRIGGDPMLRNSVYREFDSRAARNEYPTTQEFLRQPPVFNSFNTERLVEFRRLEEPTTPMEHDRYLEDTCSNHFLNLPNLRNPRPSSSQTQGHDGCNENISNVFD